MTTSSQRQRAYRARKLAAGMTELRGVYLPPALHAEVRRYLASFARDLMSPENAEVSLNIVAGRITD